MRWEVFAALVWKLATRFFELLTLMTLFLTIHCNWTSVGIYRRGLLIGWDLHVTHSQVVELVILKALGVIHKVAHLILLAMSAPVDILPLQTVFVLMLGLLPAHLELLKLRRSSCILVYHKFVLTCGLDLVVGIQSAVFTCFVLMASHDGTVVILSLRIVFGQLG